MSKVRYFLAACAALLFSSSALLARQHKTAITISPLHLLNPVVEFTGEFAMSRDIGVAAIAGLGSFKGFTVFEIGGQYNYYLVGNFNHGMQIGAELLYVHLSKDAIDGDDEISGVGRGLGISPLLGYKYAAGFGLTFNIQAGPSLALIQADAERASDGATGSASGSEVGLLLNINIGWSF